MTKKKVNIVRDFQSLRIYLNEVLHLEIRMNNHDGIQSWLEGSTKHMYVIEFYRKKGGPIKLGYDDYDLWIEILNQLDKNI